VSTILTTDERFRRYQRDLKAYRRRRLLRRSHSRFHRDLDVMPHLFLAPKITYAAPLCRPREEVLESFRHRIVWTLDTAARLVCGIGFLAAQDLTGYYVGPENIALETSVAEAFTVDDGGLVGEPRPAALSLDPAFERLPFLVLQVTASPPPKVVLASGHRVVTWAHLMRDLQGTLGWRPDLLTRIEDSYLGKLVGQAPPADSA
jgi:hypothetical protein